MTRRQRADEQSTLKDGHRPGAAVANFRGVIDTADSRPLGLVVTIDLGKRQRTAIECLHS